jgi:ATP-dependent protease ClpP protease subunit
MKYIASFSVVLAAALMAAVLLSGRATVNFNHNPKFDRLLEHKYYRYDYANGDLNIYLTDGVRERDGYLSLIQLINNNKDKKIKLYLAGNGGRVDSTLSLWFTLKHHPKEVTTIIYSNVYSAHALLGFAGNVIIILDDDVVFMFHIEAVNGELVKDYCDKQEGKDRSISKRKKCHKYRIKLREQYDNTIMNILFVVLNKDEIERFYKGEDILLSGKEIKERLEK